MTSTKPAAVDPGELRDAFELVNVGGSFDISAYISLDTGKIHVVSDALDDIEEVPADLETSDRYIALPDKRELDLGTRLVLSFIKQELPADYETVAGYFRRRGAYGRFKELLSSRNMLQKWYDHENRATEEALREWCEDNDIKLDTK